MCGNYEIYNKEKEHRLYDIEHHFLNLLSLDASLQSIIDEAHKTFENPVCVYDLGSRIICQSKGEIRDPEKMKLIQKHYQCDQNPYSYFELYNRYRSRHGIESFKKEKKPILAIDPPLPTYIASEIHIHDTATATFDIYEVNRKLTAFDLQIASILERILAFVLERDRYFSRSSIDEFLKRQASESSINLFKEWIVVAIQLPEEDRDNNNLLYLTYLLQSSLPSANVFLYNDTYICILCEVKPDSLQLDVDVVTDICHFLDFNHCFGGVSHPFRHISDFPIYWKQAVEAIRLGTYLSETSKLYYYCDMVPIAIIDSCHSEADLLAFCHPALISIMQHDNSSDSNDLQVLMLYLKYQKNKSKVAQELKLNRGTVINILQRISSCYHLDLDDKRTVFQLKFSFLILEYQKRRS